MRCPIYKWLPRRFGATAVAGFLLSMLVPTSWGQASAPHTPSATQPSLNSNRAAGVGSTDNPSTESADPEQEPAGQEPTANGSAGMFVFKKEVQEVILYATVVDDQRNLVSGLDRSAFTVFANGGPQTITSFRRQDVPVAMGIVVDNSGSMRDKRDEVNRAVLNLIRVSNPQDEIFVVNFGENYYLDQDFTSDVSLLQTALHQISASGTTALYDAVVASAVHLRNNRRRDTSVLLVITDGQDNMSQETLEEALRRLQQENGPTVYAVGLTGSGLQERGRAALQRLAEGTGGVAYFPQTMDKVESITQSVAHDIRSQYVIAYSPHNQDAEPDQHSVRVEAHAPGYGKLTVSTRSGLSHPAQSSR